MNANDIWSGNIYAYVPNKGKGIDAPDGAMKVRAIRVIKRLEHGKQRETAYVVSEILDMGSYIRHHRVGEQVELRARDYVDFWDDYAHRREEIEKEEFERQEAHRVKMQTMEEERERARAEKEREKQEILEAFSLKTGIPVGWLVVEYSLIGVRNTQEFRNWLMEDTRVV